MLVSDEVLDQLRASWCPGTRVRAVRFRFFSGDSVDDNETVPPGTLGTVASVDDTGTVHIDWDNRAKLGACVLHGDRIDRIDPTSIPSEPNRRTSGQL